MITKSEHSIEFVVGLCEIYLREITKWRHNLGPVTKVRHTIIAYNFAGLTDFKLKSTSQWLGQHRGKIYEIVGRFMKECITLHRRLCVMESFRFSCVFVNGLGRRRSSITSRSRFEMNEQHRCDADVLRCCSITKLVFEPATYDAVTHLAGVHLLKTTKPEHAKSRDTRA
jgi:hypothetical protein